MRRSRALTSSQPKFDSDLFSVKLYAHPMNLLLPGPWEYTFINYRTSPRVPIASVRAEEGGRSYSPTLCAKIAVCTSNDTGMVRVLVVV